METERKTYTLKDGTEVWQEPLLLGQMLAISEQLKAEDLQGILKGDKVAQLLKIILGPADVVEKVDFNEQLEVETMVRMVQDFFTLNPSMTNTLIGFSNALPIWLAKAMSIGRPSTNGKGSKGSPGSSAAETSANGSGS